MKRITVCLHLSLLLGFYCIDANAQNKTTIENLKVVSAKESTKISKAEIFNKISFLYKNINVDSALHYNNLAVDIATHSNNVKLLSSVLKNRAIIFDLIADYNKAVNFALEAEANARKIRDELLASECLFTIGHIYYHKAENETFKNPEDLTQSLKYYNEALKVAIKLNDSLQIVCNYIEIGLVQFQMGNNESAVEYLNNALDVSKRYPDNPEFFHNIAKASHNIALVYASNNDFNNAAQYFRKAAEIDSILNNKEGVALIRLAEIYLKQENFTQAIILAENSLDTALLYNFDLRAKQATEVLQQAWAELGDYEKAYLSSQQYLKFTNSIYSEEFIKKLGNMELKHQFDLREKETELKHNAEIKHQKLIRNASLIGLALTILLVIVVLYSYFQKRKSNKQLKIKNAQITQQKEEIEAQRDLAAQQRDLISEQKQEITHSIEYAFRIQSAVIPDEKIISEILSDYFILYRPRDIVSGDFYWIGHIKGQIVILAADCTGHGVPGAFMSMLGVAFLNEIINKEQITNPATILNRLRQEIIKALKQTGKESESGNLTKVKDGMDVAAITINLAEKTLLFAGANNPLYMIKNNELMEIKGNKMPIAVYQIMDDFECHSFSLGSGDSIYIFSDGFPDQFGGPQGKKFKYKPFKELLLSIQDKPMQEQKETLNNSFDNWINTDNNNYEQIDDVMVIGIRI